MLRPRSPQSLGFSISDIPIIGPVVTDVGRLLTGDICGAIPLNIIPGLKDMVAKVGCNAAGRDALAVYLTSQCGPVCGAVGVGTAVTCICSGQAPGIPAGSAGLPPPETTLHKIVTSPLAWAGAAAVILALVVSNSKKKGGDRIIRTEATTTYAPTSTTVGVV